MKKKNVKLEWNVLMVDFNSGKLKPYNVFNVSFIDELHKEVVVRKKIKTLYDLRDYIDRWARGYFWCRSECEILVRGLFVKNEEKELYKVDIYNQLEMNLDRITEYVNNKLDIKL